ncbi:MAG: hypothetical protein ABJP33_00015 [Pseudoruegeria sp.]
MHIPINGITVQGWQKKYKEAAGVRLIYDPNSNEDEYFVGLEAHDGSLRYLIDSDGDLKKFDTLKLVAFYRDFTDEDGVIIKSR